MTTLPAILIVISGVISTLAQVVPVPTDAPMRCEVLRETECKKLGYNLTYIPNFRNHMTQKEAAKEFNDFMPLVTERCSNAILHFLCSFYFPVCFTSRSSPQAMIVKPCRRLCEYVEPSCSAFFSRSTLSWPTFFNCSIADSFSTDESLCFGRENLRAITIPSSEFTGSSHAIISTAWLVMLFGVFIIYAQNAH